MIRYLLHHGPYLWRTWIRPGLSLRLMGAPPQGCQKPVGQSVCRRWHNHPGHHRPYRL